MNKDTDTATTNKDHTVVLTDAEVCQIFFALEKRIMLLENRLIDGNEDHNASVMEHLDVIAGIMNRQPFTNWL